MSDTNKEFPIDKSTYTPEYLNNTKAPVQLMGLSVLLNPFADHTSSQRLMMWSSHLQQIQVLHGCEFPRIYTGFESMVGEYEYTTTEREDDVQVRQRIPRFRPSPGPNGIDAGNIPSHIIVYHSNETGRVGYFELSKFTMRADGYGYANKWNEQGVALLNEGTHLPKNLWLSTSPAHKGNMYMMGTNLRTAYMSLPQVTEDAFIISESAAKKLTSDAYTTVSFRIAPNQIPVDCYGTDEGEYKIFPELGQYVRDDGILCALRTPSENSFVYDVNRESLRKPQFLHDTIIYAPPGAQVVDIDVVINRSCKVKTPPEVFEQVYRYREALNIYHLRIWNEYLKARDENREIEPAFNTLVTRALESLSIDGERIPRMPGRRSKVTATFRKEAIEFMYITITLRYENRISAGFKTSGRYGNEQNCSTYGKLYV